MAQQRKEKDGLCALFRTREAADLAVEHLAQEYGIDPAFIYVEPLADENSSGVTPSGGDAPASGPGHGQRRDAPLHGVIQLTVPVEHRSMPLLSKALREIGALEIEVF